MEEHGATAAPGPAFVDPQGSAPPGESAERRLRIAVVARPHHPLVVPFAGHVESHTAQLAAALHRRGHEVTVFAKEGSHVPCGLVETMDAAFDIEGYPKDGEFRALHARLDGAMNEAMDVVLGGAFDIVLNASDSPVVPQRLAGFPAVHVHHFREAHRVRMALRGGLRSDPLHAHITVSEPNAVAWRQHIPRMATIPPGIDMHWWRPVEEKEPGTAVWTGRIAPHKGTHVAVEAATQAGLRLTLAGRVEDHDYFTEEVVPRLNHHHKYVGHLRPEELAPHLASAEVFLNAPQWEEPFPHAALEAMACGTPVASLPSASARELLVPGTGVIAEDCSPQALARAALRACRLSGAEAQLHARGYSLGRMTQRFEDLMEHLVDAAEHVEGTSTGASPVASDPAGPTPPAGTAAEAAGEDPPGALAGTGA